MTNEQTTDPFFIVPLNPAERMYCGPTTIALLTGKPREEIHRAANKLRRARGAKRYKAAYDRTGYKTGYRLVAWPLTSRVTGMNDRDLLSILAKSGVKCEQGRERYGSLRQLVEDVGHMKCPVIVNVTGHYLLLFRGVIYDTFTRQGAPASEHPFIRTRVKKHWFVRKQRPVQSEVNQPPTN